VGVLVNPKSSKSRGASLRGSRLVEKKRSGRGLLNCYIRRGGLPSFKWFFGLRTFSEIKTKSGLSLNKI
jgi:hypothetical protein